MNDAEVPILHGGTIDKKTNAYGNRILECKSSMKDVWRKNIRIFSHFYNFTHNSYFNKLLIYPWCHLWVIDRQAQGLVTNIWGTHLFWGSLLAATSITRLRCCCRMSKWISAANTNTPSKITPPMVIGVSSTAAAKGAENIVGFRFNLI